jgi:peptidoglycan hydrolase FlgJ
MTVSALAGAAPAVTTTPASGSASSDPIKDAAKGLEGIFMSMLVDQMMQGTDIASANPVYSGLMTQKLGDQLAESGGIGLASVIERQLGGGPGATTGAPGGVDSPIRDGLL